MYRPDNPINFSAPWSKQSVRVVCEPCNTTWMCELEGKVSPFLGPMITSAQSTPLRINRQTLLATWAVKTALVCEHLHPSQRFIPDSEYERFYAIKRPPPGYVVWVAYRKSFYDRSGRELLVASREQQIQTALVDPGDSEKLVADIKAGARMFISFFAFGHVVMIVFGHTIPKGKVEIIQPPIRATQWIWPPNGRVVWPPTVTVEDVGGIEALQKAIASES